MRKVLSVMRIGIGYDVHRLVKERKLILGGIEIPFEKGLEGHSDADVLIHAVMDALLGAAGLGDIGKLFPDSDPAYKGISSMVLLENTEKLIRKQGYEVNNIDVTVVAQKPKISPYTRQMINNISRVLGIKEERINIKGTTTEGLGFTGREEGIAAFAVCTIKEITNC